MALGRRAGGLGGFNYLAGQSDTWQSSPYHITTMYVHTHHLLAEVESNRQNPLATPDCMLMRLGSANRGLNWHI